VAFVALCIARPSLADIYQPISITAHVAGIGDVVANVRIAAGARPTVEFTSKDGRRLLRFRLGEAGPDDAESTMQPRAEVQTRSIAGLPAPLFVVVVMNPHGSALMSETALVGPVHSKLAILHAPWVTEVGPCGIYLGDLGGGRGLGVATWTYEWKSCHSCPNPYRVEFFPWLVPEARFAAAPSEILTTKRDYESGADAILELGLRYKDLLHDTQLYGAFSP
jgi:hypothetical protein